MAAVSRPGFSEGVCGEGLLLAPALGSSGVRGLRLCQSLRRAWPLWVPVGSAAALPLWALVTPPGGSLHLMPPLPACLVAPAPGCVLGGSSRGWSPDPHCGRRTGQDASWGPSPWPLPLPGFPPPPTSVSQKGAGKTCDKGARGSRLLSRSVPPSLKLSVLSSVEAASFSQTVAVTVESPKVTVLERVISATCTRPSSQPESPSR